MPRRALRTRDLSVYHERTRRRGVNPYVYWPVRLVLQPLIQLYFWLGRTGREHVPGSGGVLIASNHRSFLDPFTIGCCVPRPMYFVAKQQLFRNPLIGWILNSLGAFPVRRGASDEESLHTARILLERGAVLTIFPEGTRIRSGALREPRRGVGRLALETGVPVVPVAVIGSERARRGWRIRPCRVRIRVGRPLGFPQALDPSPRLAAEVTSRIWPCVRLQWEWLGGLPPLRRAAVVGGGSMGTALAVLLARAGLDVQLGCRTVAQAEAVARRRENPDYLAGVALPDGVTVSSAASIEFGGVDLVVLAVPSASLPQAVAQIGDRVGRRSAVLVASKGLVGARGATPSTYVQERLRTRAVGCLAGPAHAGDALRSGASVVLATRDPDLRDQLVEPLAQAGLQVEATDDLIGAELAGVAKNAAALAAAAAAPAGVNAAGAVAGRVFAEIHQLAVREGARSETFVGLSGVGDLVSTVLAPESRNRRAGELLGSGVRAEAIEEILGQAAEGLSAVPLADERAARAGLATPALGALRSLVEGDVSTAEWLESAAGGEDGRRRRAA